MDENQKRLLAIMKPDQFYTATQLSSKLDISEKTVRQRIKEMNLILPEYGAEILSASGQGFRLSIIRQEDFSAWQKKQFHPDGEALPTTVRGRVIYIVERFLYAEDYLKLDALCQELYISRTTITADMKQVKVALDHYHLAVVQRPGYGIILEGNEFDRRNCMVRTLIQKDYSSGTAAMRTEDAYPILSFLSRVFKQQGLKTAEWTLKNLIFYIGIAILRIRAGHTIRLEDGKRVEIRKVVGENVVLAVRQIAQEIENYAGCPFDEDEQTCLMIHLGGKSDSDTVLPSEIQKDEYIGQLVAKMLESVYETNGLDFRTNEEVIGSLKQHLVPFDVRMKYDIPQSNPILGEIKEEYSVAYAIAATAVIPLEGHYQKPIPEEEIGFFAILFALALQKREQSHPKKNVVVVCVSGQASSRLFIYRYRKALDPYIDHLYECSAFAISDFDFEGLGISYVFTTVPITFPLPVPVIQVSILLSNEEIEYCQRLLSGESDDFISRYFREELFLGMIHGGSKTDILSFMCQNATMHMELPDDFYEAVCQREELGQTDFGNLVAIPHPCRVVTQTPFVVTAVLDKPIWWGHNDVQVVLLIALAQEDREIERFLKLVSNFIDSRSSVQSLIQNPTYSHLMELFCHNSQI